MMAKSLGLFLMSALLALGMVFSSLPARADETAEEGRKIVETWQQAVVTLEVVCKRTMSMFGEEMKEEEKAEARGVVIEPSGLVVTALTALDVMSLVTEMMEDAGEEGAGMKASSEITSVKIILSDGKELVAQIVLRDKDLDLAFIRPVKAPEQPLPALSLEAAATPQLLDRVYVLDRLGTGGNRTISITADRVRAIVTKPRPFYVMTSAQTMGVPVFTAQGQVAGIITLRRPTKEMMQSMSMFNFDWLFVAIPIADVAEVAKQAPQVKKKE